MHTAHLASLRSAIEEFYETDESDWQAEFALIQRHAIDPHVLEHEARAAELLDSDDDDAAWIHEALRQNMKRAARDSN